MPRPRRVVVEGGVCHVFNRVGRGERVFDQANEAQTFVEVLRRASEGHELRSRRRDLELVRARELPTLLGVERYGLQLVARARDLAKSPDGMTKAVACAPRRRVDDLKFQRALNKLDRELARPRR